MNRNTIEKKGNSIHCSFSFSLTFFFTLLFFNPLSSSRFDEFFPFPFFVIPNFHYRGKQFLFSFFLSLSLSLFFFFNLVFLSFFFSLGFWPYHISNFEEVTPSFFLSFFVTFDDFISLVIKLWRKKLPFLFSLSPLRHLLMNLLLVYLIFQHWEREFLISFSFSLSLFLSLNYYEKNVLLLHFRGALEK